jgi:hypothetical protein
MQTLRHLWLVDPSEEYVSRRTSVQDLRKTSRRMSFSPERVLGASYHCPGQSLDISKKVIMSRYNMNS